MVIIPVYPQVSARWITSVELDGTTYVLRFDWSVRESAWYLDILNSESVDILNGLRLVPLYYLLEAHQGISGIPPGDMYLVDEENNPITAIVDYDNLGVRFKLVYIEFAEL